MTKLWGSRFKKRTDKVADRYSFSISYDHRLALYDVLGSIAHAKMLGQCKIISKTDASKIVAGLKKLGKRIERGTFKFDPKTEDIHTNVQNELKKIVGSAADKLHTARSRNDLIVLDMKLFCLVEIDHIIGHLTELQKSIVDFAQRYQDVIIPAYTHLQSAQVVLLAHHVLAYVEMIERDKGRLKDAVVRMDSNPLGSCALSGTTLPTDRDFVTKQLGFIKTAQNSMDAVSDRDFLVETISGLAITGTHFSRIAEDLILWATEEFNRIDIDFAYCTGSSIMPHKKNPDILELIRGDSAKLISNLNESLVLLKGLPLTYNRDMQLDKLPLFSSVDKILDMTVLLTKIFSTLSISEEQKAVIDYDIASNESFYSVDMMEYLIQKGVSYRQAHDAVGALFKDILKKGVSIQELSAEQLKKFSPKFENDVKKLLNPKMSVKMKKSLGSTNPAMVKKQINSWKRKLK